MGFAEADILAADGVFEVGGKAEDLEAGLDVCPLGGGANHSRDTFLVKAKEELFHSGQGGKALGQNEFAVELFFAAAQTLGGGGVVGPAKNVGNDLAIDPSETFFKES